MGATYISSHFHFTYLLKLKPGPGTMLWQLHPATRILKPVGIVLQITSSGDAMLCGARVQQY